MHETEICVFGAGPAGVAVASRLLAKGRAVTIVERPPRVRPWGGESFTGAIRAPLVALGCWEAFRDAGHVPGYERECAWGGDGAPHAETTMLHPDGPLWHVDRDRFDDDLRSTVVGRTDMVVHYRKLDALEREGGRWRIVLDGQTRMAARYLIDATGRSRALARRLGARIEFDDRLVGFTARSAREGPVPALRSMVIQATPFGWWYAAPTPSGHVLAVFTDLDLAPASERCGLRPVAANSAFTHPRPEEGWLPVGDACASHDPLCGWGVHRALTNGLRAADAVDSYLQTEDPTPLEEYGRRCHQEYRGYLQGLTDRYSIERRWPAAPFWQRRQPRLATT